MGNCIKNLYRSIFILAHLVKILILIFLGFKYLILLNMNKIMDQIKESNYSKGSDKPEQSHDCMRRTSD